MATEIKGTEAADGEITEMIRTVCDGCGRKGVWIRGENDEAVRRLLVRAAAPCTHQGAGR